MKQWFIGKFRGHYRGFPGAPSALSPYPKAPHFSIEVYEAIVSEIELGPLIVDRPQSASSDEAEGDASTGEDDAPRESTPQASPASGSPNRSPHHAPTGSALHQHHIGKVHLIDAVRPGQTIRSTAHDVLMSAISLSHPASSSKGTLGHIEGVISGWYLPPPEPPPIEEVPAFEGPPPVGWRTETMEREPEQDDAQASSPSRPAKAKSRRPERPASRADPGDASLLDDEVENEEELDAVLSQEEASAEYPFFSIGLVVTLLLGFFATPFSATLFGFAFLACYGVRRWLLGVIPDVAAVRVLSLVLGSLQMMVAALLIVRWSTEGCVSLSPLPLIWLLGAQMTSSLLPRPLPFALTSAGFAAVLFQAYGTWAPPYCPPPSSPAQAVETTEPLEQDPSTASEPSSIEPVSEP